MAIETRRGRQYYYKKHRVNGHVVSEYVAAGDLADIAALLESRERGLDALERQQSAEQRAAEAKLDRTLDALHRTIRLITKDVLCAEGFYLHKRQWRPKRDRIQHQP